MVTPYKVVYFCDAVFLGGAEAYLKLLVPEIPQEEYQPRVALSPLPQVAPLVRFFEDHGIRVDEVDSAQPVPVQGLPGLLSLFPAAAADHRSFQPEQYFQLLRTDSGGLLSAGCPTGWRPSTWIYSWPSENEPAYGPRSSSNGS